MQIESNLVLGQTISRMFTYLVLAFFVTSSVCHGMEPLQGRGDICVNPSPEASARNASSVMSIESNVVFTEINDQLPTVPRTIIYCPVNIYRTQKVQNNVENSASESESASSLVKVKFVHKQVFYSSSIETLAEYQKQLQSEPKIDEKSIREVPPERIRVLYYDLDNNEIQEKEPQRQCMYLVNYIIEEKSVPAEMVCDTNDPASHAVSAANIQRYPSTEIVPVEIGSIYDVYETNRLQAKNLNLDRIKNALGSTQRYRVAKQPSQGYYR